MTTTFETAKVGDRVYSIPFGWGEIEHIDEFSSYPINVHFFSDIVDIQYYTYQGYFHTDVPIQSIFWDEVYIEAPTKPVGVKVINGVEVPDISFKPTKGEVFLYPSIDCMSLHQIMTYNDDTWCKFLSDNNLCYPYNAAGQETVILHTKAMLGIKE
jgi:hypothetical protein